MEIRCVRKNEEMEMAMSNSTTRWVNWWFGYGELGLIGDLSAMLTTQSAMAH